MSVVVAGEGYGVDLGGQFGGYGNHGSYGGDYLDGSDVQGVSQHNGWSASSPGDAPVLQPPYWQDCPEDWPSGDYGGPDWSGTWGPHSSPSGPDQWRYSRQTGGAGNIQSGGTRQKRRFCTSFPDTSMCRRGLTCAFAHSREEIGVRLLDIAEENQDPAALTDEFFMYKYKTRWCPIGVQHEWHTCVYAHNYQDARRPVSIGYGTKLCPYWSKKDTGAEYAQRCPLGLRCPYSHGAKEQLYHPHYFKTVVCRDLKGKACPRQRLCAFFHNRNERRSTPVEDPVDYTRPLVDQALDREWVEDFMSPPFLPEGNKGGCGGCGAGPGIEDREWYGDAMGPMGAPKAGDGEGAANGAMVPYSAQVPDGVQGGMGQPMFPAGQPNQPCVLILPIMSSGSPDGNACQQGDMPATASCPMLPPNWMILPMTGGGPPAMQLGSGSGY